MAATFVYKRTSERTLLSFEQDVLSILEFIVERVLMRGGVVDSVVSGALVSVHARLGKGGQSIRQFDGGVER